MKPQVDSYRAWAGAVPAKYELLRVLGSGGMGTVLLARDRELGRLVALKLLRESCALFLERLRREARIMARLVHPAIVPVYEFEGSGPRPYLALSYVRGGNLTLARLEPRALVRTLRGVVDALAFAHRHGIVHRDVKPENILLETGGRALLSDFGLALEPREGPARARAPAVAGTPVAMSPEQARGFCVGPASDQFSLGVTLYRQLTGQWPFRGRTLADVLIAIEHEEPVRPRAHAPGVPRALEACVLRCLAKEPGDRFASMEELAQALDRVLAGRTVFARALERLTARASRRPLSTPPRIHPSSIHPEEVR